MLKKFMKNKKGFTLAELMVVVVILGILVAIAVPIYNNAAGNAAERANLSNIRIIQGAVAAYRAGTGNPTAQPDIATLVSAGYLESAPTVPSGINDTGTSGYSITYSGTGSGIVVTP